MSSILIKRRSTTKRLWDRIMLDYYAKKAIVYSKEQHIVKTLLGVFCCYIDVWYNESSLHVTDIFPKLKGYCSLKPDSKSIFYS